MSAASLGSITNSGGTVYIAGTWNNSGQTLNGSASFGQLVLYGGTISGGTVTSAGVAFTRFRRHAERRDLRRAAEPDVG